MKPNLRNYFLACYPCVAIQTTEEQRAIADVLEVAKGIDGKQVVVWSATEGLRSIYPTAKSIPDSQDLVLACSFRQADTVYIMLDIHTWPFDRDPILVRSFKDLLLWAPENGSCVVVLASSYRPHPTFEKMVVVMDYSLPSKEDLKRIATGISESAGKQVIIGDDIIRALGGLNTTEAENALALSLVQEDSFNSGVIYREKIQAVKKSGLLEIVDPDPQGLDAIGGLDALKAWILKRKRAYTPEAEAYGLPSPKGILLVGVPGTGKSLSAKAVGIALGVPTLKLDIGSLFNSLVGASEERTRDALKLAEAISPCVLWVDEIDKGLAGSSGSGANDSGVTRRVFGTIISWMQERRRPVFLVATANDVSALPPEFLRKGRWDEIFAVDLPTDQEREAIIGIHLRKRGRDPKRIFLDGSRETVSLIVATKGFTGSEIENVVEEAMFNAFDEGSELNNHFLLAAASSTVPLSTTAKEQIETIRTWAQSRARFASTPVSMVEKMAGRRKIGGRYDT